MQTTVGYPTVVLWRQQSSVVLVAILLLAAGLRFWNVTHDSDLSATVSTDARGKFIDVKHLVTEGDIPTDPNQRYELFNQPLFLIRSYGAIWKAMSLIGLDTDDERMRIGFTAYMILLSLGTVALVFLLGKIVFEERNPALYASLLFAVFPVNVVGSLYVKEDIPLMFWFTAAMVAMAALVRTGRRGGYLWSGPLIGLAVATKYTGLLLLPIFILAHLFVVFHRCRADRVRGLFAWQFFAALGLAALAFVVFNIQVITEWPDFLQGFLFQVQYANTGHRDGTVIRGIDYWWTFYLRYAIAPGITLPVTLFFLTGLVISAIKRNRPLMLVSAAVLITYFQFENSPAKPFPFFARYLHMAYPLMAILVTYALFELRGRMQHRTSTRTIGVLVGLFLVLVPLCKSTIIAAGVRSDTRLLATRWIEANLPRGARIALGSRPYTPQHLDGEFQVRYYDTIHSKSVQQLKAEKFAYLVVTSFQYDRYPFSLKSSAVSRAAVQGYQAFERELQLIQEFRPQFSFQSYGEHNPVIRIYRIPQDQLWQLP
jgi:hypothetical protein